MITCIIMGGLGNQLFQIFAMIGYAFKYKDSVIFTYSPIADKKRCTYWETFLISLKSFTTLNPRYNIKNETLNAIQPIHWLQHHYEPFPQFPNMKITRLYGYFQSYKYFDEYRDTIFRMIRLQSLQKDVRTEYSHYFQNTDPLVSMHFRYGDYKHLQEYHNLLPYQYYFDSVTYMRTIYPSGFRVLYFCEMEDNDIITQYIHKLKNEYNNIEFIKVDDSISDWKQMLIMSCCNSQIIANSTYSWWGAYFNMNEDKHVCYPSKWFGPALENTHRMDDMFLPFWHKIEIPKIYTNNI